MSSIMKKSKLSESQIIPMLNEGDTGVPVTESPSLNIMFWIPFEKLIYDCMLKCFMVIEFMIYDIIMFYNLWNQFIKLIRLYIL